MTTKLTKKDFQSDQMVRWCPGCGDYTILSAVQKTLPELGVAKEDFVFISGIGCSSRFPYYVDTFGFHTIHGRAPAIATGLKMANPDLSVWVITGDGDGLSIGGNHLMHVLRRNVDLNIIMFNNEIYGLTKGQYSPTSHLNQITKSSPYGVVDTPFNPVSVALGAGGSFIARSFDKNQNHMSDVFKAAHGHRGTSFVEVLQNCNIFNDGAHEGIYGKDVRDDNILFLEPGKPLIFGKDKDKGIIFDGSRPEVVEISGDDVSDIHIHDPATGDIGYFMNLAHFHPSNGFPFVMGVIRDQERPSYERQVSDQEENVTAKKNGGDLQALLESGDTWVVS